MVEKLVLGTVQFGLDYGVNNPAGKIGFEEVSSIIATAHTAGIDALDTAAAYGDSESVLGRVGVGGFKVVSKLKAGVAANDVRKELEASLANLHVPSLYGYLFHDFATYKSDPATYDVLQDLKQEGKAGKIGFSLYHPEELEELWAAGVGFDMVQVPYSIFDQRFEPLFQKLKDAGVEIHVRSVFLQGLVFKEPETLEPFFQPIRERLARLREISKSSGLPIEALCLGFALVNSHIDKVLIGVDSVANLQDNIAILSSMDKVAMRREDLAALRTDDLNIILPFNWKRS